jgi:hypothetical protein
MSDSDGNNLVQLSKLNGDDTGVPRWSPDGKKIAFAFGVSRTGNQEIYVVDVSERVPKKLVTDIRQISNPWSRDGQWIYFNSGDGGYRCAMMGGSAVRVGGGEYYQESFLYSAGRPKNTGLIMSSLDGAFPESAVEGLPPIIHAGLWTVVPGGYLFRSCGCAPVSSLFRFRHKEDPTNLRSSEKLWHGLVHLGGRPLDSLFTSGRGQHRHHARRSLPIACVPGGDSFFELLAPQGWIIVGNSLHDPQSARANFRLARAE